MEETFSRENNNVCIPLTKDENDQGDEKGLLVEGNSLTFNSISSLDPRDCQNRILSSSKQRKKSSSFKKFKERIITKNGDVNVRLNSVSKESRRFLADIFTTLVDSKWRYTLLVFSLSFILEWLGFGIIWWLISFLHGDFEPEHLPNNQVESKWNPCVTEIYSFASCFLFSVETQHTIGYGSRHVTEECHSGVLLLCMQSIIGIMSQAFMVGVVFAKLARPTKRTETVLFSRHAVIACRDGRLCLMFRVGDLRKTRIIEAHVRALLIRKRYTAEGELIPFEQVEISVGFDGKIDKILMIWPTIVMHIIDDSSPLYDVTAYSLHKEKFEILVTLEGISESTSTTLQARSSYLPCEIRWGHRFEPLVTYKSEVCEFHVDMKRFNRTYKVDILSCSSRQLDMIKIIDNSRQNKPDAEHPDDKCLNGTEDVEFPRTLNHVCSASFSFPSKSERCFRHTTYPSSRQRIPLVMTESYAEFCTWRLQNKWDSECLFCLL